MAEPLPPRRGEMARQFALLGLTAFGGPTAHLAFFRERFVQRLRWINEAQYANIVALCQVLPGPASSQVGLLLGYTWGGHLGAFIAWLCFTLPSAILMAAFAWSLNQWAWPPALLQGLKIAALAVVCQALWGMAHSLCPDAPRRFMAALATLALLVAPTPWAQAAVMLACGAWMVWRGPPTPSASHSNTRPTSSTWRLWWLALIVVLMGSAAWAALSGQAAAQQVAALLRVGASVFGGGHVVLPMLQAEFVAPGWVDAERFQAAYGAAQALPGPLFTFAAFLGADANAGLHGAWGAAIATVAIFLPAYLLVMACWPLWHALQRAPRVQAALAGVNAAVVGVLAATALNPMLGQSVHRPLDAALLLLAIAALVVRRSHPLAVIAACLLLRGLASELGL